ncbi:MAG: GNAT family N-acetyltransferase, partial [Actinomycetota bacterium]|nr:GNAT family N-acetyltransferase [Actinomycetota bacterium]
VEPSRQGTGLGRALVVGGLASLAERGVTTGMLFVDAENDDALRLYASLGFTTSRVDRAYEREA